MTDISSIEQRYLQLMHEGKFEEAIVFLGDVFERMRQSADSRVATHMGSMLVSALIAAGKDGDALETFRRMLLDSPSDLYLRLRAGTFVISILKQPAEALQILAPAAGDLLAAEETRHATLGVLGTIYAELGRSEEAERCLREMIEPSLARMYPSAFDFMLVESLVARGETPDLCKEYLATVLRQAQEADDRMVAAQADSLLARLEAGKSPDSPGR
jgi:tetratricopeptide (TPR) repeat protein